MERSFTQGRKSKRLHIPMQPRWRPSPAHSTQLENRLVREAGTSPLRKRGPSLASTQNQITSKVRVTRSAGFPQAVPGKKIRTDLGVLPALKEDMENWLLEGLTPGAGGLLTILVGFVWAGLTFI